MAPKRKAKGGGGGSKRKKAEKKEEKKDDKIALSFERYADGDEVTMEGLGKLADDLGIDPTTDTKLLVLCWRLGAEKPGVLSRTEWDRLSTTAEIPTYGSQPPTVDELKKNWGQLDPGFFDNSQFRPFFKFCFEFNREGTKKFLEKDTAIALLPLCIENRSVHTTAFVDFLTASKPDDFKLNKDQWCSFLDFSLAVGPAPTFQGWDADESSWPILLDEFVEYVKANNDNKDTKKSKKK